MMPSSFEFFWQPPAYPFDPAGAKKLLAQAGYPNGFDGGDYNCDAAYTSVGEAILNYWQPVGIRARLRPVERAAFYASSAPYEDVKLEAR